MNQYICKDCNLVFKVKKCLTAHVKTQKHLNRIMKKDIEENKYKCVCGKAYKYKQGLYTHRKTCTNATVQTKKETEVEEEECENESLKQELQKVESKNKELKEEISQLKSKITELSKLRTNTRRGINKHMRKEVITEQNDKCNTCNKQLTEYNVNIDHKIGVQFGGTNDMDNLQALCVECHSEKTIKERRNRKKIQTMIEQILSE